MVRIWHQPTLTSTGREDHLKAVDQSRTRFRNRALPMIQALREVPRFRRSAWLRAGEKHSFTMLPDRCPRPGAAFQGSVAHGQILVRGVERSNRSRCRDGCAAPILFWRRSKGYYPRTETPEKESTARPGTGWPKRRAGSKRYHKSRFCACPRVVSSVGPETMR